MSEHKNINITLKVWRQNGPQDNGRFKTIAVDKLDTQSSFLTMVDRNALGKIIQAGGIFRSTPAAQRMPMRCPSPRKRRKRPWTRLPASAAVPAWHPVRMPRPCSLSVPRSPSWHCCPRADRKQTLGDHSDVKGNGCLRIRQLHKSPGLRGCMS
jgi:hypothetical protein